MLGTIASLVVAYAAIGIAIGLLGSRIRGVGIVLALLSLGLPFLIPRSEPLLRVALTFGTGLFLLRAIDLARERRAIPPLDRVWLMFAMFDVTRRRPVRRELDVRALSSLVAYGALAALGAWMVTRVAPNVGGSAALAARWGGGALALYATADATNALLLVLSAAAGFRAPLQHDAPALARSVGEFWSARWNLEIHAWLRRHAFWPLARRGHVRLGVAAAFVASAALHFWLVAVPLGIGWALPMAAFFLLQGSAVLLESAIAVRSWSRVAQHMWTIAALLGTSPLFIEPMLRALAI